MAELHGVETNACHVETGVWDAKSAEFTSPREEKKGRESKGGAAAGGRTLDPKHTFAWDESLAKCINAVHKVVCKRGATDIRQASPKGLRGMYHYNPNNPNSPNKMQST